MKDITLKITGKQFDGDSEEENLQFITDGKLYERAGATYLVYEESEFSGFPGCKTSLRFKGSSVRMKRLGSEAGFSAVMEFEEGKRFKSDYETPYGTMDLEILTKKVDNQLDENGTGVISIDYLVSIGGTSEGRNSLKIEVN